MPLDHEKLDVYGVTLDFMALANAIITDVPRGNAHLCDQLSRSSTSIVLNLAEGVGKYSRPDKRRFYMTARGSATESAALLDVLMKLNFVGEERYRAAKEMIERIVAMLVRLIQSCE